MESAIKLIKSKGKIVFIPIAIILVLISIFIFNGFQKNGSAIVNSGDGEFIEASGTVESNSVAVSSEVTGTIIESDIKEGDKISSGQIIAHVNNTILKNQYEQAKINYEIAEKNMVLIDTNIKNFKLQHIDTVQQAQNAYLSAEAEYEKIMEGASSDEIKQAEEAVSQAEINKSYMKTNLDRSKELLEQGALSQSMFDETQKSYNVAEAQYNTAVSQLNLVKSYPTAASAKAVENKMLQAKAGYELAISNGNTQLQQLQNQLEISKVQLEQSKKVVEQSKVELDKTAITSPIDGVVNSLFFKQGEFISIGKQIAEIYNPDDIEIIAYISEANIGYVKIGQEVNIFVDSYDNQTFNGKVKRINDKAEFTPKNIQTKEERVNTVFEVKIEVVDTKGVIKPGMPVDVSIRIN